MDPTLGGVIAGGLAGAATAYGQYQANKLTARLTRRQMAFQEYMSGTAYQRMMADMEAAGLNPMLAMRLGGASTPSGASSVMQNVMGSATSSALQAARARKEVALLDAQINKVESEREKVDSDKVLNLQEMDRRRLRRGGDPIPLWDRLYEEQLNRLRLENQLLMYQQPAARITGSTAAGVLRAGGSLFKFGAGIVNPFIRGASARAVSRARLTTRRKR